jgi:hypothetical protein
MKTLIATCILMLAAISGQVYAEGAVLDRDAYFALQANSNSLHHPDFSSEAEQ